MQTAVGFEDKVGALEDVSIRQKSSTDCLILSYLWLGKLYDI